MGRRASHKRKSAENIYSNAISNKEFIVHDHKLLQKILGPESEHLDYLEDNLPWPLKPQADLDAEWDVLCDEYSKLTGSRNNNDGTEIPSIADLCYYIGDWALKYVGMGNNIPTQTGTPPTCAPYWARNQVLLFADNGKVCPPQFKLDLEDEIFFLLHHANKVVDDEEDENKEDSMASSSKNIALEKVEIVVRYFFFAGKDLHKMFEFIYEEYEKRLRRGLIGVHQTTLFCDLFCNMVFSCNGDFIKNPRDHLNKIKNFVVECEKLKTRSFFWPPQSCSFYEKLPLTDSGDNTNSTKISVLGNNDNLSTNNTKNRNKLMAFTKVIGIIGLFVSMYIIFVVK